MTQPSEQHAGRPSPTSAGWFAVAIGVALAAASALAATSAEAQDEDFAEDEEVYAAVAVQNRVHFGTHEFGAHLGLLPMDAFTKGITLSGSYTLNFSDLVGWEVVHGLYSIPVDTDLRADLAAYDLNPTPFEVVEAFIGSAVILRPIYWKGAWLNDSIVFGEISFVFGGAYGIFTRSNRLGLQAGLQLRLYTSESISIRFDTRYVPFFNDSVFGGGNFDLQSELWVAFGVALGL